MSRAGPPSGKGSSAASKRLVEAVKRGRTDDLEALLRADESAAKAHCTDAQLDKLVAVASGGARREQQTWFVLHLACFYAPAGAVQLLLQHGAAASSKASPCGWTPAMVACCSADPAAALANLQAIAETKQARLGKPHGSTSCMSLALLHSRSRAGSSSSSTGAEARLQLLRWLVQNGAMPATMSIPAAQEVGRRLLLAGQTEQLLPLMREADPAFAQGAAGFAGLFRGVAFCQEVPEAEVEAAVKLLMQSPFQVNAPLEARDMTPGQAALRGYPCVLKLLLEAGLDVHARLDNMSMLLHFACYRSATADNSHAAALVQMLLDAGSDPNVRDAGGELPLGAAIADKAIVPLLWPPVTKDAAEFSIEGAPVSEFQDLLRSNEQQIARIQSAILKVPAHTDSARATMAFHLLYCGEVNRLMVMLPLLAVPTPARQLAHGLIWARYFWNTLQNKGAEFVSGGIDPNTGMLARGTVATATLEGCDQLRVSPKDMQTFMAFFRKHPDVPALHYAVYLVRVLKEAVCTTDSLVALLPAGLKAALAAKEGYLTCGQQAEDIFDACVKVVSTVSSGREVQVHQQPAMFQPFIDAGHHLDLAAVCAHTSRAAAATGPLAGLMAFQVVQVEVIEYWQQNPSGFEGIAGVVHTMCDVCEGKLEATTPAMLHDGVNIMRGILPCMLFGQAAAGGTHAETIKGNAWSPAWERRLEAAKQALLEGPLLAAVERLSDIPMDFPQLKKGQMVSMVLGLCQDSIRIARFIAGKPDQLDHVIPPEERPQMHSGINPIPRSAELNMGVRKCAHCGATSQPDGKALVACSGCTVVYYCGRQCQVANWKAVHKHQCKKS